MTIAIIAFAVLGAALTTAAIVGIATHHMTLAERYATAALACCWVDAVLIFAAVMRS